MEEEHIKLKDVTIIDYLNMVLNSGKAFEKEVNKIEIEETDKTGVKFKSGTLYLKFNLQDLPKKYDREELTKKIEKFNQERENLKKDPTNPYDAIDYKIVKDIKESRTENFTLYVYANDEEDERAIANIWKDHRKTNRECMKQIVDEYYFGFHKFIKTDKPVRSEAQPKESIIEKAGIKIKKTGKRIVKKIEDNIR